MTQVEHVPLVQAEATEDDQRDDGTEAAPSCGRARVGGLFAFLLVAVGFATYGSGLGLRSVGKGQMQVKATSAYPTIGILSLAGSEPSEGKLKEIADKLPSGAVLNTLSYKSDWANDFPSLIKAVSYWDAFLYVDEGSMLSAGYSDNSRDKFRRLNRKMTTLLSFVKVDATRFFYVFEKEDADVEKELERLGGSFSIDGQVSYGEYPSKAMSDRLKELGKVRYRPQTGRATSDQWVGSLRLEGSAILMPNVKYTFLCEGTDKTVDGFLFMDEFIKKGDDETSVTVKMVEPVTMYGMCLILKNPHGPAKDVEILGWGPFSPNHDDDLTLPKSKLRLFGGPMLDPNPFDDTALPGNAKYEDVTDKISELEADGTVFACWGVAGMCGNERDKIAPCAGQWVEMDANNFGDLLELKCDPIILVDYVIPEEGDHGAEIATVLKR